VLASINEITLRRARLVLGWATGTDRQTYTQVILYLSNAHALHWTDNNVKLIIHLAKSSM